MDSPPLGDLAQRIGLRRHRDLHVGQQQRAAVDQMTTGIQRSDAGLSVELHSAAPRWMLDLMNMPRLHFRKPLVGLPEPTTVPTATGC